MSDKNCLMFGVFVHLYLPAINVAVEHWKDHCLTEAVVELVHSRDRIATTDGEGIQFSAVDTEAKGSVHVWRKHN